MIEEDVKSLLVAPTNMSTTKENASIAQHERRPAKTVEVVRHILAVEERFTKVIPAMSVLDTNTHHLTVHNASLIDADLDSSSLQRVDALNVLHIQYRHLIRGAAGHQLAPTVLPKR